MRSVTLDSNIYVSALNYGGQCLRILNMARAGAIRLDISNSILEEVGGVLRSKFHWPEDDIELAQREIAAFSHHVSPQEKLLAVPGDDDDTRIVECAATAGSDYLVTGDKHLLRLRTYGVTQIVKPAELPEFHKESGAVILQRRLFFPSGSRKPVRSWYQRQQVT